MLRIARNAFGIAGLAAFAAILLLLPFRFVGPVPTLAFPWGLLLGAAWCNAFSVPRERRPVALAKTAFATVLMTLGCIVAALPA